MSKMKTAVILVLVSLLIFPSLLSSAEDTAQIKEEYRVFKTYPFSDPDPFPNIGRIYPYFKFSGYSHDGSDIKWKVVSLENSYIRVFVTPDIGGKVWGAVEKSTGNAFIYFNKVVKFRNIAMRGPWTSGGIEFNFGAIGHTPAGATPVDYLIKKEDDGSVSCYVGGLDLPSRTEWRVKIHLPKDKAYFETECFWANPTPLNQSLYHWMNAAARASNDLHFHYPGSNYIGHGGKAYPWPIDKQGRNISIYGNNDFGPSKSYHILGKYTEFFSGYWNNSNFGYGNWSLYDEKPGKKLWLWTLSRSGGIWEDLLTDPGNGQYIEMQTGLLLNQAGSNSTLTPFKHAFFAPLSTHKWKEIWFPVKDIGGVVQASPYGALNVVREKNKLALGISPLRKINDRLVVIAAGKEVFSRHLKLSPMETYNEILDFPGLESDIKVDLGHGKLTWSGTIAKQSLERPMETDRDFNWSSAQGLFITADELAKQRYYGRAMSGLKTCLQKDPYYLPALSRTAELYFRRGEYKTALKYAKKALAVSTYDPEANFIYGAVQKQMGQTLDAKDGFGWAARSMALRSAAYNQLAAMELKENHLERARYYAVRSLDFNRRNLESYKILAVAARLENKTEEARKTLRRIEVIDPLDHFVRFETYLLEGGDKALDQFKAMIQNELPQETYLELALKYVDIGRIQEGISVLKEAPSHSVVHLWLAYLTRNTAEQDSCKYLDRALKASPYLVFPFRLETIPALEWAIDQTGHWKAKYYLGLLFWNLGRTQEAGRLFQSCQNIPDYPTFYLARAELLKSTVKAGSTLNDIQRAIKIDPENWRAWRAQTRHYLASSYPKLSLKSAAAIQKKRPQDYILAMDLAKALVQNNQFKKSLDVLTQTNILPYEGAREGRDLYRQAGLLYALSRLKDNAVSSTLALVQKARQWPENLGAGKPYDTDERLEDYVAALCYEKTGKIKKADNLHENIIKATRKYRNRWGAGHYISALVLRKKGKAAEAEKLLSDWIKARPGNNVVARWAAAKFHNLDEKASAILKQMAPEDQGTPWNPGGQDNDFPIVLSISRMKEK